MDVDYHAQSHGLCDPSVNLVTKFLQFDVVASQSKSYIRAALCSASSSYVMSWLSHTRCVIVAIKITRQNLENVLYISASRTLPTPLCISPTSLNLYLEAPVLTRWELSFHTSHTAQPSYA